MDIEKVMRLSQVARKLNIGKNTILEFLAAKGFTVENNPNSKISLEQFQMLSKEFASSAMDKEEALGMTIGKKHSDNIVIDSENDSEDKQSDDEEEILIKSITTLKGEEKPRKEQETEKKKEGELKDSDRWDEKPKLKGIKVVGKIELEDKKKKESAVPGEETEEVSKKQEAPKAEEKPDIKEEKEKEEDKASEQPKKEVEVEEEEWGENLIEAKARSLKGLTVVGKIDLPKEKEKKKSPEPIASSDERKEKQKKKRPRKRIKSDRPGDKGVTTDNSKVKTAKDKKPRHRKEEVSDKEIQEQLKATLAKLSGSKPRGFVSRAKYRRDKRSAAAEAEEEKLQREKKDAKVLNVNEFISANDLASMMNVSVNEVISTCMSLGMFVSINQRLDAEAITIIADEFGYDVRFSTDEDEMEMEEEMDSPEDLRERSPIVTIMGHVDHGKTSLLDFIRHSKVTEEEAGGITQHIGAYEVITDSGRGITFLDTPGHEAFTAMRARGAKITDVAIIVVAADDNVMPQTKEAINHAMVAEVPIVIAINKIDKANSNPEKIKEELANINILVEDWGGKYQSQEISAKTGVGIDELLEKVLLEAEMLELKSNPDKPAAGTIIEASLDKGRGYVATILVQGGTLQIGDIVLAGTHFGRVKAMFDHVGNKIDEAGPAKPVLLLGLDGAPQAGDKFHVMQSEREARDIANKRQQLLREQSMRTKKHITLDEIGRRLAIGNFKELNVIVKGDVDGSVEALSDSLLKLSTEEVQVNIIHKAVGQISESDVLLASASDAIIIGFQVRPSANARRLAEQEEIEIRLYSIIYDAINHLKDAMEGMLAPEVEEVITGNVEIRDVFKISKVGTVAGCMVTEGSIKKSNNIRLVRDGIVIYTGEIHALKRFKEDVGEVKSGYECGISIKNYNDMKVGDVIEAFEEKEVARKL
ncbi:MAG: translation initiation factor IF-2 [Cyclobacteriaceae bacterium]|nr:translation initiation factor IF-2 [Cyclobacteriaceae bacterium]